MLVTEAFGNKLLGGIFTASTIMLALTSPKGSVAVTVQLKTPIPDNVPTIVAGERKLTPTGSG